MAKAQIFVVGPEVRRGFELMAEGREAGYLEVMKAMGRRARTIILAGLLAGFVSVNSAGAEQTEVDGIEQLRKELREAELRYTPTHPQVVRLKQATVEATARKEKDYETKLQQLKQELRMLRL